MLRRPISFKQVIAWILRIARTQLSRCMHLFRALFRRLTILAPLVPRGGSDLGYPDRIKSNEDDSIVVHTSCQPPSSRASEKQRMMPTSSQSREGPVLAPNGVERLPSVTCGEQKNWTGCSNELGASEGPHNDNITACPLQCRNKHVMEDQGKTVGNDERCTRTMKHIHQLSASPSQKTEESTLLNETNCSCSTDRESAGYSLHVDSNGQLRIDDLEAELSGNIALPGGHKIEPTCPSKLKRYDHNIAM